jgi:predicted hotdog family 3-hydroxylacyl-ACP dehydratase
MSESPVPSKRRERASDARAAVRGTAGPVTQRTEIDAFPPLEQFMPHRAPMLLIDALVAHDGDDAVCEKTFTDRDPFVQNGVVSSFIALELFAQAAAAHFGYEGLSSGGKATSGALLGARKIDLSCDTFPVGEKLTIKVKRAMSLPPMAQFECVLANDRGDVLAVGTINVAMGV